MLSNCRWRSTWSSLQTPTTCGPTSGWVCGSQRPCRWLQTLPHDCYEAARVDGIHPVLVFFRVTLPLIRQALMVAVIFRGLDALRVFDLVYVLTSNSNRTATMSVYARDQLVGIGQVGYGSAASTMLFLIVAVCAVATITIGRVRLGDHVR